jgi:hypothetical protein
MVFPVVVSVFDTFSEGVLHGHKLLEMLISVDGLKTLKARERTHKQTTLLYSNQYPQR